MIDERFLVDTSIWIKCFRKIDTPLKDKISSLLLEGKIFTTEIIIMEILMGAKSDREYKVLYRDLLAIPLFTTNHEVWKMAWDIAYKLRKNGVNISMSDIIISAAASYYRSTLLHSDKHFNLIARHIDLKAVEL